MEGTMKKSFAAALAAVVLAGCATSGGKVVDKDAMAGFKPGVTTIAEVEATFGPPYQETKQPDGTDQLQYISKVKMKDESTDHTTGSNIPRQIEKTVSSVLVFDQNGRFVHAWTADKTVDENVPGNMGKMQSNDVTRGSMYSHGT
jgi:outer membrane protein assembly factor BamE (lipoprotein component of BamABCDE complex)